MSVEGTGTGYRANVYFWNTKAVDEEVRSSPIDKGTTVGHTSIELEQANEKKYFSFRPQYSWLVNPFLFFLPSKATTYSSLDKDNSHEGREPDEVHLIPLTSDQYEKMSGKIREINKETEEGQLLYHLFPRTSILAPAKALASRRGYEEMSRCPFSGLPMNDDRYKEMEGIQSMHAGHCATTVNDILSAGGITSPTPKRGFTPWIMTPSNLGSILRK